MIRTSCAVAAALVVFVYVAARNVEARQQMSELDRIYADESHCLIGPEMRAPRDYPISCYCRDALTDVHYVYQTYSLSGRDRNLNGTYLTIFAHAQGVCGKSYDVLAAQKSEWNWWGPEVTRIYPPDDTIEKVKPDNAGMRRVHYRVRLIFRNAAGQIVKTENYDAIDRIATPR